MDLPINVGLLFVNSFVRDCFFAQRKTCNFPSFMFGQRFHYSRRSCFLGAICNRPFQVLLSWRHQQQIILIFRFLVCKQALTLYCNLSGGTFLLCHWDTLLCIGAGDRNSLSVDSISTWRSMVSSSNFFPSFLLHLVGVHM